MTGERVNFDQAAADDPADKRTNERSTIEFPYLDLETAVEVANKLHGRTGISACELDELAAEMDQTVTSGNFRLKTSAARTFGFIEKDGSSAVKLTDLGCRLVSPDGEKDAKAAAFLKVPLYSAIYEKYRGKLLPPTKALEREMQMLGVATKQADKARHAFQRSARQSGFFDSGDDRLVRPRTESASGAGADTLDQTAADAATAAPSDPPHRTGGSSGGSGPDGFHPFIQGLLQTLPEPETNWTVEGRAAWLKAAANIFTLIYKGDGDIRIETKSKQGGANGSDH